MSHPRTALAISLLTMGAACSGEPPPARSPTYQGSVRAIVQTRCLPCHVEGGVAPFALDDYAKTEAFATAALAAMESGRMPPWSPDPDCHRYQDERLMPDSEVDTFREWVQGGRVEGEVSEYVAPPRQETMTEALGPPTLVLAPDAAYTPDSSRPDDYRCFPLAHTFDEEAYLKTSVVLPDRVELAHHVILYLVAPQFADLVDQLDAEDSGPGYTCFGGVGVGQPTPIGGWTPGNAPPRGSADAAIRIPKGARLVMQMHYNVLSAAPSPDQTQVQLWLLDHQPNYLLQPRFFTHIGIDIKQGDSASKHVRRYENNSDRAWSIVATSPHMHLLGQRLRTVRENQDGTESCLVDIKNWDFSWQQSYVLPEDAPMQVQPGEALNLECTYDNSEANQPMVNGVRQPSRRVTWGEGTLDEMCLNSIVLIEPFTPLPEPQAVCGDFQPCYDACKATSFPITGCILQCGGNTGCASCVLPGLFGELASECGVQGNEVVSCLEICGGAEDVTACVNSRCGTSIVAFDQCARPRVEAGEVDRPAAACGISL